MTRRSLFAKIFLWFWLANTLVLAALAFVVWMFPFTGRPHPGTLHQLHGLQVRGALAARDSKGNDAFEDHARDLEQASGLRTYWFDEDGRDVLGGTVPEHILQAARSHAAEPANDRAKEEPGPPLPMVFSLTDARGRRWVAVAEPSGSGPGPYFLNFVSPRLLLPRMFAAVLAAGVGCYALARYLTLPLRRLQRAVGQLASGDLLARVDERLTARRDELGDLGRDVDRMARQVASLLATQKRLVQDVSHELRSPLARLNVALELAVQDSSPAAAPALARVGREADRLNELIGQLLTLARLEGTPTNLQQVTIDLSALVAEIAADADFEAAASGRQVRVLRCDHCQTVGAPSLLRSAIENVVRNAVQYTADGTAVEVSLTYVADGSFPAAHIEIRDRGPGVPDKLLPNIFQPFYRVSNARDRQSGGTGLGLAITERAIQWHGGNVHAENVPNGGFVVHLRLPCATPISK